MSGPDIFGEIVAMMDRLPPAPRYFSWSLLSKEAGLHFVHEGREHIAAHPAIWKRIPKRQAEAINPFLQIEIVDLDVCEIARAAFLQALADAFSARAFKPRGGIRL